MGDQRKGKPRQRPLTPVQQEEYGYQVLIRTTPGLGRRRESIKEVAADLQIDESTASRLLERTSRRHVLVPMMSRGREHADLELALKDELAADGIRHVEVVPSPADDTRVETSEYRSAIRRSLGLASSAFVAQRVHLRAGSHVCLGGGRTLMAFAHFFEPSAPNLVLRPLATGGRWRSVTHADAAGVLTYLYWRLELAAGESGPEGIRVVCPEIPPGMLRAALNEPRERHPEVEAVFGDKAPRPDLVVSSIGRRRFVPAKGKFGPSPTTSTFVRMVAEANVYLRQKKVIPQEVLFGALEDTHFAEANAQLFTKHVVGDLCRHALTADGAVVPGFLDRTSKSVSLELMRTWRKAGTHTILISSGSRMLHAFRAAIATRTATSVIVDTALAVQLVSRKMRPSIYRDIPTFKLPELVEDLDPKKAYQPDREA